MMGDEMRTEYMTDYKSKKHWWAKFHMLPISENFFGTVETSSLYKTGSALNCTDFSGILP